MNAQLSPQNFKVFAKAVSCLAKLGTDVTIDQQENGITLRTIDDAQASFAQLFLNRPFFQVYQQTTDNYVRCKLNLKNFSGAFHGLSAVEKAWFRLDAEENLAILELEMINKVRRKFFFNFEELPLVLQADFSREMSPNKFISDPAIFETCLNNFLKTVDEVSLIPTQTHLAIKSYSSDRKKLSTEYQIDRKEFQTYELTNNVAEVTFCVDELKAIRAFCSACKYPIHMYYDCGGSPILFSNCSEFVPCFYFD